MVSYAVHMTQDYFNKIRASKDFMDMYTIDRRRATANGGWPIPFFQVRGLEKCYNIFTNPAPTLPSPK